MKVGDKIIITNHLPIEFTFEEKSDKLYKIAYIISIDYTDNCLFKYKVLSRDGQSFWANGIPYSRLMEVLF